MLCCSSALGQYEFNIIGYVNVQNVFRASRVSELLDFLGYKMMLLLWIFFVG